MPTSVVVEEDAAAKSAVDDNNGAADGVDGVTAQDADDNAEEDGAAAAAAAEKPAVVVDEVHGSAAAAAIAAVDDNNGAADGVDGVEAQGAVENAEEDAAAAAAKPAIVVDEVHGAAAAAAVAEAFAEADMPDVPDPPAQTEEQQVTGDESADESKLSPKCSAKKRRVCRFPGCSKTVKAQGHCQRHGAKTKRCKAPGCSSQAQGSHEGYCKRHWRELAAPEDQRKVAKKKQAEELLTCEPIGSSVYDGVVPASFSWKAEGGGGGAVTGGGLKFVKHDLFKSELGKREVGGGGMELRNNIKKDMLKQKEEDQVRDIIPILQHMLDNEHLDPGWHRVNERLARGLRPPKALSTQLESWEKQLAVLEMALMAGTDVGNLAPSRATKALAHAWGREKGFHKLMIDKHCARRGDAERKKRVDAGTPMAPEKRVKLTAAKAAKKRRVEEARKQEEAEVTPDVEEVYGTVSAAPGAGMEVDPIAASTEGAEQKLDASAGEQLTRVPSLPPAEEGEAVGEQSPAVGEQPPPTAAQPPSTEDHPPVEDPPPMEEPSIEEMVADI